MKKLMKILGYISFNQYKSDLSALKNSTAIAVNQLDDVVIGDTNEPDNIPLKAYMYRKSLGDGFCHKTSHVDECKNLIYVAISRAKHQVVLLFKAHRLGITYNAFKSQLKPIATQPKKVIQHKDIVAVALSEKLCYEPP